MKTNESIRLRTEPGSSSNIVVKIEQEFDTIDFLSLKITQDEAYRNFCSDYGVLAGRVIANDGFGVENAKISIFIPLSDEDSEDPIISSIYPYITPADTNSSGVRYNLLPKLGKTFEITIKIPNNSNGDQQNPYDYLATPDYTSLGTFPLLRTDGTNNVWLLLNFDDGSGFTTYRREVSRDFGPTVPVGTFPDKFETLDNDSYLEVYNKYYKYTTRTNSSGDYMLFGIPLGTKTVHMDVDFSDIGSGSLTVDDFTSLGVPPSTFNGNKFNSSTNLDTLTQIEGQNLSVDIIPFWGNTEECEIGISRLDFKLTKTITPSSILFFQAFTNTSDYYIKRGGGLNSCGSGNGNDNKIRELKYKEPLGVSVEAVADGGGQEVGSDIASIKYPTGNVLFSIPMYEAKFITDETGNLVPSPDPDKGIPTQGSYKIFIFNEETNFTSLPTSNGVIGHGFHFLKTRGYRYDLINRKRLLYTIGQRYGFQEGQDYDEISIAGNQKNSNQWAFPGTNINGGEQRMGKIGGNGETPIVYGSLYMPRLEAKDTGDTDAVCPRIAVTDNGFDSPNGGVVYYENAIEEYGVLDVTDILSNFKVFGGNLPPTSANNNIWDINLTPDYNDLKQSNQTYPVQFTVDVDVDNNGNVNFPKRLNVIESGALTDIVTTTELGNNGIQPNGSPSKSHRGWYYFYFGLYENNTSLEYLKQNLGV